MGEFVASAFFLFFSVGSAITTGLASDSNMNADWTATRHLTVAFAFGFSIVVLVYAFANVSGAHINPAVTLALTLSKKCSPVRFIVYIVSQVLGAAAGTSLVRGLNPDLFVQFGGGCNGVHTGYSLQGAFCFEVLATALLVFTVFAAIDPKQNTQASHVPALVPLPIGLAVFLAHALGIRITGCGINPARSFGTALVANCWDNHYMFWVAPFLGAVISAVVYEVVVAENRPKKAARGCRR